MPNKPEHKMVEQPHGGGFGGSITDNAERTASTPERAASIVENAQRQQGAVEPAVTESEPEAATTSQDEEAE